MKTLSLMPKFIATTVITNNLKDENIHFNVMFLLETKSIKLTITLMMFVMVIITIPISIVIIIF